MASSGGSDKTTLMHCLLEPSLVVIMISALTPFVDSWQDPKKVIKVDYAKQSALFNTLSYINKWHISL